MKSIQDNDVSVVATDTTMSVKLPLTCPTGKVRIKRRSFFADYGEPVAPRSISLTQDCYVEWQIGYDLLATKENTDRTCLSGVTFKNYKGEEKFAYELAEIAYHSLHQGKIGKEDILDCMSRVEAVEDKNTFEETASISRTNPREEIINGLKFHSMLVTYPLFVHRFGRYEIISEIVIREKQRAVGAQAMLYLCLPITSLAFKEPVLGRTLDAKECATWMIGRTEAQLALELFNVFGMLSPKHHFDVLQILKLLANWNN